ncbi:MULTISPECIES: AAA family ATPase [unclassified Flavobacterium]|uniref:AAA family ATPase n=1 Tax=unclassified Flavobacterium TaxID=196869 RepID=UPI003F92D081
MKIYKLGCIWGKGAPNFYEMIKSKNISLSHSSDCNPKNKSIILIANGHTVKAITILLEDCQPVTNNLELKDSFDDYRISYNNETLYAKSKWIELKPEDYFLFKTQDGICQIHKQEIHQITKSLISKYMLNENLNQQIELLNYKKQIILQGPPGTGKTRLAKEIAESFAIPSKKIDIQYFKKIVLALKNFKSKINENSIAIESVKDEMIYFEGTKSVPKYNFSVNELYDCYSNKDYLETNFVNYPHYAKRSLVWYIIDGFYTSIMDDQCNLIQFHPSYTYEDFVRGIVSVPNEDGEGVVFKTENKILAEFAEKALKNKLNSQKEAITLSKEKWLNAQFEKFIDFISDELEKNRKIALTEAVLIVGLDTDAFRYNGKNEWTAKGTRMLFKDIKQAFLDNNTIRQELKLNQNVSRSAYWDATYFLKAVELFRKFLTDQQITFVADTTENEPLKNYVLIIDEINRANLPSVLGELIYALEYRNEPVESMYEYEGKREIVLPDNLYIIGTMNTADRSVGHIDYAIKRRFAFVDVLPEIEPVHPLIRETFIKVSSLFVKGFDGSSIPQIIETSDSLASDFRPEDIWIGHSYFICKKENSNDDQEDEIAKLILNMKLKYEIIPLLKEYIKDGILNETEHLKTVMNELISTNF